MVPFFFLDTLARFPLKKTIESIEAALRNGSDGIQLQNLAALLQSLKNNQYYSPFLRENSNININNAVGILKEFPFLTKALINSNEELILNNPKNIKLHKIQTSGSSGVRGFTHLSHDEVMMNRSLQLMWWMWAGYTPGQRAVQLGVNIKRDFQKAVKDILLNIDYKLAFGQTEEQIYISLKKYRNGSIPFLAGYASSLFLYALVSEKFRLNIKVEGCISWGDKLFDHFKEKINAVFGCRVTDTYGSSEGFNIAAECEFGAMHVMTPHVFLEVLDDTGADVKPGQIGEVVLTRLDARHFPLVRYRVGDLVIMKTSNTLCSCGRKTPIIERVIGRDTDIIHYEGGYLTVQVLVYILKQIKGIEKWQIVQSEDGTLTLKICVNHEYNQNDEGLIREKILVSVQNKLNLNISYVDSIENPGVGKPQLVISKYKKKKQTDTNQASKGME